MEQELVFELLEERANKLRLLARHMLAGQRAFVRWDLEAIEEHHAAQEQCCRELFEIDREISSPSLPASRPGSRQHACAPGSCLDASRDIRLRRILEELESLRQEVLRINNIHAEFLKRSRRSLNVLSNIVLGALGIYEPPKAQFLATPAAEGGR